MSGAGKEERKLFLIICWLLERKKEDDEYEGKSCERNDVVASGGPDRVAKFKVSTIFVVLDIYKQ